MAVAVLSPVYILPHPSDKIQPIMDPFSCLKKSAEGSLLLIVDGYGIRWCRVIVQLPMYTIHFLVTVPAVVGLLCSVTFCTVLLWACCITFSLFLLHLASSQGWNSDILMVVLLLLKCSPSLPYGQQCCCFVLVSDQKRTEPPHIRCKWRVVCSSW